MMLGVAPEATLTKAGVAEGSEIGRGALSWAGGSGFREKRAPTDQDALP
jgi:hypothetical protein